MRIGIDARLYSQTGVGRYIRNLIFWLGKLDNRNEYYIYLNDADYNKFNPIGSNWRKRLINIPWHTFIEQLKMPGILLQDKLDVAHFPYFNVPMFYPGKYLLTIHDLILDHFDTGRASRLPGAYYCLKRYGYRMAMANGVKKARHITTISQVTKKEIIDHYNIFPDRITVTYDALDSNFSQTLKEPILSRYFKTPYILYVGNAYPHKNLEFLLKAFQLIRNKIKIKLVLAGDDDYFYPRIAQFARNLKISEDLVFFGNADDKQLINLYSYAKMLVFPSLMEGFGLPNLEAVSCGKLAVASDISSFREIWQDTLVYFSLDNIESLVEKILLVYNLSDTEYKNKLQKAQKRLSLYNWETTALETLKIYEKIFRMEKYQNSISLRPGK